MTKFPRELLLDLWHVIKVRSIPRIQKQASPVDKVATAIEQALTADRPKPRYLIGADAKAQVAMRAALPTRALDAVIGKAAGQPRSA